MITREQALQTYRPNKGDEVYLYCRFTHKFLKNQITGETIYAVRVGTTRVWDRNKNRFEIPIRIGKAGGLVINENNAHEWTVTR